MTFFIGAFTFVIGWVVGYHTCFNEVERVLDYVKAKHKEEQIDALFHDDKKDL